jgi:hypothetical protein
VPLAVLAQHAVRAIVVIVLTVIGWFRGVLDPLAGWTPKRICCA